MIDVDFIPIDYDYFDFQGKNYVRIIGRDSKGKRICAIDSFQPYFWAILKNNVSEKRTRKIQNEIENIEVKQPSRTAKVEKTELHEKNFLGKSVKAVKVFISNCKDAHDIAEKINFPEVAAKREYDLNLITKYIIEKKFIPLSAYKISGEILTEEFGASNLDVDMCIKLNKVEKSEDKNFEPNILAFDIETDEFEIGKGEILMISLASKNFRKVLTWKKASIKEDYVEFFKDEAEMIEKFVEYVKKINPDILVGYFSDGFDMPYLRARAEKNKIKLSLGLDSSQPVFARGKISSARIFGIVHIDLFRFIETVYSQYLQSETLGLNEVASELLGEGKKEFLFKHSNKMKEDEWKDYFEYNLYDSILTYRLAEKFWPDMLEFSRILQEPLFEITRDGMSKLVESYILHHLDFYNEIAEKRPLHDEIEKRRERKSVEGAFVLQPKAGLYENLCIFDFTSMHTSIIVSFNISKATLLEKKEKDCYESPEVEWEGKKAKFYFSKKPGFLSHMLKDIIEKRKKYKREYQKNPNPITKAGSNAFKLLSAAVHGYIGFFGARYYSLESSASILAFVRKFNKETIDKVNKAGYKVIYSDSVEGKTKVIIKNNGEIYEKEIKELFEKTDKKYLDKEYNVKNNIEVLTLDKNGKSLFKPIKHVMRHKCNKKMYRINFTNNWHIDVTEDHSLIGYQATNFNQSKENKDNPIKRLIEIKPQDINKKANTIISLKKIPYKNTLSKNYPKEVYEFIGYFIGDGSFMRNKSHQKYNKDYYLRLSLGSDGEEIFKKLIKPLIRKRFIKNYWWSKTRKGDITLNGLRLVKIISEEIRDIKGKKKIPNWLFKEKEENISSFLRGLFSADGCVIIRNNAPIIKYTSINENYVSEVRKLLFRIGISHSVFKENSINKYKNYSSGSRSINIIIKNKEIFAEKIGFLLERKNKRVNIKTNSLQKKSIKNFEFDLQMVKNVEEIKSPKYVYDLEVENNHKFFANYVLAHNTDSVAFTLENKTKNQTLESLKKLNSELPGIMELELEDFYERGLWVTKRTGEFGAKKKYALINEKDKLKIRGFETVRRDWCSLARELQNKVLQYILRDGNEKRALEIVKKTIADLKERKIERAEILIKTQLKKPISEYKSITPHVIAAKKMQERGKPLDIGMLMKYFIAETRGTKKLVRDKVKLPDEKGEYNIEYYLEHQIIPSVENIFEVFGITKNDILGRQQKKLMDF